MRTVFLSALLILVLGATTFAAQNGFKKHEFAADFVSWDPAEKTITFRAEGDNLDTTLPVSGKASDKIEELSTGERLTLTCLDDEDGQHVGIIDLAR
jgi:hypothetical protein